MLTRSLAPRTLWGARGPASAAAATDVFKKLRRLLSGASSGMVILRLDVIADARPLLWRRFSGLYWPPIFVTIGAVVPPKLQKVNLFRTTLPYTKLCISAERRFRSEEHTSELQ